MTTVRALTPADYEAVAAISKEAFESALVGRPTWESGADVAESVMAMRTAEFVAAEDPAQGIVGFAGYDLDPSGEARLYGPLVTAAGQGIGGFLASRIEQMARQRGATLYSMLIGLQNRAGSAWADWRGYQLDSEEPEMLLSWAYPGRSAIGASGPVGPGGQGWVVRPAVASDLDAIYDLYQASFPPGILKREHWSVWVDQCQVLERQGRVAAAVRLDAEAGFLYHLCVDPAQRRQGLGGYLLQAVLDRFWSARSVKVGVAVRLDNSAAVSFFRSQGFGREIPVARWTKRAD